MKKTTFIMAIVLVAILSVGAIAATAMNTGTATNVISSSVISIKLHDETAAGQPFPENGIKNIVPEKSVDKVVYVENTCDNPEWIRVSLDNSVFIHHDGEVDTPLDFSAIALNIDSEHWQYSDGWYYYKEILAPASLTPPLFTTVTLSADADNAYAGSNIQIVVNAQGVQADNNEQSFEKVLGWPGTTVQETEITSVCTETSVNDFTLNASSVMYNGKQENNGYAYTPESTDLFQNFKNVMPGDTLWQNISLKNDLASKAVKVYMYADTVDNKDAAFLSNMAIAVYNGNKLVTDNNASEQGNLAEKVLLGTIAPSQKLDLIACLRVKLDAGNEFAEQKGNIVWHFVMEETDDPVNPHMGTSANVWPYALILGIATMALFGLVCIYRKTKKQQ